MIARFLQEAASIMTVKSLDDVLSFFQLKEKLVERPFRNTVGKWFESSKQPSKLILGSDLRWFAISGISYFRGDIHHQVELYLMEPNGLVRDIDCLYSKAVPTSPSLNWKYVEKDRDIAARILSTCRTVGDAMTSIDRMEKGETSWMRNPLELRKKGRS